MKKTRIICFICAVVMAFSAVNAFAINNGSVYNGSNGMTIDGGKTHTDPSGNTVANMTLNQVNGVGGKLFGDKVYEYKGFSDTNGGGSDYIGMWYNTFGKNYVIQTQICLTEYTTSFDYQIGYFVEKDNTSKYSNANIMRINARGELFIFNAAFIQESQQNVLIKKLERNRWYNVDIVIQNGANYVTVYVDGVPTVINFTETVVGMRHFRLSTGKGYKGMGSSESDIPFLMYLDNISSINTSDYNPDDDKHATLVSDTYQISDSNVITLDSIDASAEEVLSHVTADSAKIRLYSDSAMKTQITGDMGLTEDSVLVVAKIANNQETSYNYYTFTFPGVESNMFSGTQAITLAEGGNVADGSNGAVKYPLSEGYTQSLEYPVFGGGGKKSSDGVYYWGGKTCGSGGHWYMNVGVSSSAKPAHIFEIAFKLDEGASGFSFGPAPFVKDADGKATSNFPNVYGFSFTLDGVKIANSTSSSVTAYSKDGTNNVFAQDTRGSKIGDVIPGRWHTFTMITYADGTSKFDVYFDGIKKEFNWNFNPDRMRHVRMYALTDDNQAIYFDNFKSYGVTVDEAKAYVQRDTKPQVEFIGYDVKEDTVTDVLFGTKVADIKNSIVTNGNIRIYKDATFTQLAADSDEVTDGMMVVASAKNGTAYDRAFSYYTLATAQDYDELTAYTRVSDLKINEDNDKYYVSFNAKNLNPSNNDALDITVAVALYDSDDTLIDIAFGSAGVAFGEPIEITKADDISIKKSTEAEKVRAFVWWGDSQKPFSDAAELEIK